MKQIQLFLTIFFVTARLSWADGIDTNHRQWNDWLKKFAVVVGPVTTVKYQAAKSDSTLQPITDLIQSTPRAQYDGLGEKDRLAFLINSYNALTIQWILKNYPVKSIKDTGGVFSSPWKKKFFKLFGEEQHLDGIEHGIIRKDFAEARIHFAVVCASKGCPALAGTAYIGQKLEEQLETGTKLFLSDKSRNYYDAKENRFYLSKIFDWYGDDFKKASGSVQAFVSKRMASSPEEAKLMGEASIKFLDYDWTLNEG